MKQNHLIVAAIAGLAFTAGLLVALWPGSDVEPSAGGYILDAPRALPAFELVDEQGEVFSETDFKGHWSLIYFGFTYCPDICPSSLSVMAQVKNQLEGTAGLDHRYYLISVDPDRDSPQRLAEYVRYFDPEFRGLTGAFDQLDIVTRAAGAVYKVPENPEDENYLVAHSSTLTLIDPQGRVHAIFTSPFEASSIAAVLKRVTRS